jgi:hypothetical protein
MGALAPGEMRARGKAAGERPGARGRTPRTAPGADRVRAFREAPDGTLRFLSQNRGALYRVAREEGG